MVSKGWAEGNPIYAKLPTLLGAFDAPINRFILDLWEESMIAGLQQMMILDTFFNPLTCPENWLDYLAPLYGFDSPFYNAAFSTSVKRKLLAASIKDIWANFGTLKCIQKVFECLELQVDISMPGDFILSGTIENPYVNGSELGDTLGNSGWEFIVTMPESYSQTDNERLVRQQVALYSPCWVKPVFRFNDTLFIIELVLIGNKNALDIGTNKALRIQ